MHRLLRTSNQLTRFGTVAGVGFVVDRVLKYVALEMDGGSVALLGETARFSLFMNDVMAFGLPVSVEWTRVLSLVIFVGVLFLAIRGVRKSKWETGALLLVLSGALSNLFDRFYYGFVVDYIDIYQWSVFNLADVLIIGGIVLLMLYRPHKHEVSSASSTAYDIQTHN